MIATMEVTNLCKQLISFAVQRCRLSGDPCRLSVIIRKIAHSDSLLTQISISDTGAGSCLKEFEDLRFGYNVFAEWDGMLSITTTSLGNPELSHYKLNLKESASNRRINKLPSTPKTNAMFSGTEVSMSSCANMEVLLADMASFFGKNIAIELVAECCDQYGIQHENVVLATELTLPSSDSSNIQQLASGFEDYVCKHRNGLSEKCKSCFSSRDNLKVGNGQACGQKHGIDALAVEVVIIISNNEFLGPPNPLCLKAFEPTTEVLYCRDFSLCSVHQSVVKAFRSVKWNSYGLTPRIIADEESSLFLEWENFPPNTHIDIAVHCYAKQVTVPPVRQRNQLETKIMKEAISLALDDLKKRYTGALLSDHALKIHSHAPDLARSIAGLIMSSDDPNFRGECFGLLGMQMGNTDGESIENCIKDKIISAIDMNDRKPPNLRCRAAAPFLFEDDYQQEPEYMLDEYDEGEEDNCTLMDL
ncbi:type 2 DNA topoisomerase 6 subunit B-like isoform X2 [Beta vulgaris subsp. vulgaris]|uniref:type 2 DNA topoisomerase 6 subunit B-like isoform X2 n=1 Tax=Beta vulgaris subsp. vulgaris TaxID=3555 RepID=UPI00053F9C8F|nr:type 2 DNA topoisomerase 6 subunit B-like isoform X2 [Beta vulgaris subsp. vulgaris]